LLLGGCTGPDLPPVPPAGGPAAAAPPGTGPAAAAPPGAGQRIVSLAPAITEILFALGLGEQVVGVTRFCDWPPEAARLPRVGGYLDPSPEGIIGLRPTLVVAAPSPGNKRPVIALQRLGLEVLVVRDQTLADLRATVTVLGERLQRPAAATALLARLDGQIAEQQRRVAGRTPRRALLVYGRRPLVCAGEHSLGGELLALLRVDNVCRGPEPYPLFSMERVLAAGPEVILDGAMDVGPDAAGYWERWPSLPAVAAGRVVRVDSAALRPGPRLGEALAQLAAAVWGAPPEETP
jgi:iron complex transport system substrate-binding protein